jgi:hypothetical protein
VLALFPHEVLSQLQFSSATSGHTRRAFEPRRAPDQRMRLTSDALLWHHSVYFVLGARASAKRSYRGHTPHERSRPCLSVS